MIKDKVAVITGGSHGMGLAIMQALVSQGAEAAIVSRSAEALEGAAGKMSPELRKNILCVSADVRSEEQVRAVTAKVLERFGRIDILVNAAGVSQKSAYPIAEIELEEYKRIMNTNVDGTLLMTREVLREMKRCDSGYIINILSTGAFRVAGGNAVYAASKFAARAITEALIADCRGTGIRVTSISPGPVNTDIWSHKSEPVPEERKEKMLKGSDIASIVSFLLGTGPNVHIDNITVEPWLYKKN